MTTTAFIVILSTIIIFSIIIYILYKRNKRKSVSLHSNSQTSNSYAIDYSADNGYNSLRVTKDGYTDKKELDVDLNDIAIASLFLQNEDEIDSENYHSNDHLTTIDDEDYSVRFGGGQTGGGGAEGSWEDSSSDTSWSSSSDDYSSSDSYDSFDSDWD